MAADTAPIRRVSRPNVYRSLDIVVGWSALHLGITDLGWQMDWRRFRIYLREHYGVDRAYYFVGYIPDNQALYTRLQNAGYTLVFKTVTSRGDGKPKGNV